MCDIIDGELTGIEEQACGMPFSDLLVRHLVLHQEYHNMLFLEPYFYATA